MTKGNRILCSRLKLKSRDRNYSLKNNSKEYRRLKMIMKIRKLHRRIKKRITMRLRIMTNRSARVKLKIFGIMLRSARRCRVTSRINFLSLK
jgi:hypothetical protein